MMLLPKKVGHFTLMRKLGNDAVTESYVAILDEPAGKQVVARKVHAAVAHDAALMATLKVRVDDLKVIRHPAVASVLGIEDIDGDTYVLEDWVEGVSLAAIVRTCRARRMGASGALPHNVFLDLAAQVCNGLEAMHGRPASASGGENILHMGLCLDSIVVREDGQLVLANHGLVTSPTLLPQSASAVTQARMEYLAPEQTHPDQPLSPATDIFSLGSILYELLTLRAMFLADSHLQTVHRVRRAEVTTELLEVKELLPGLDRVLYRALSLNPRHRYQRAFVLREDLRGLMAGFSFADIQADARLALADFFGQQGFDEVQSAVDPERASENTAALLGDTQQQSLFDAATGPPDIDHDANTMPPSDTLRGIDHDANTMPPSDEMDEPDDATEATDQAEPEVEPGKRAPLADDGTTASFLRAVQGLDAPELPPRTAAAPPPGHDLQPADTAAFIKAAQAGGNLPEPTLGTPDPSNRHGEEPLDAPRIMPIAGMHARTPGPATDDLPLSALETQERPMPVAGREQLSGLDTIKHAAPELHPDPVADKQAAEEARKRLAPPDSLHPPPSEPPPVPRHEAPTLPVQRPVERDEDDLAPAGSVPWLPVVGGLGVAALALFMCVGLGGASTILGARQMASTTTGGGDVAAAGVEEPAATAPPGTAPPGTAPPGTEAPRQPEPAQAAAAPREPAPQPTKPAPTREVPRPREPVRAAAMPEPVRATAPRPSPPRPLAAAAPPPAAPAASTYDAVAAADDATQRELGTAEAEPLGPMDRSALEAMAGPAFDGALSPEEREALGAVSGGDPLFTRAHTLLYLDAKARGMESVRDQQLAVLMSLPENQYNPALLVEEAWVAMTRRDWTTALARSDRAERHWARLPSDLIFSRKAMMYEIQAQAHLGSFYASEGDDGRELDLAIKGWQKYRRHAETQSRTDLMASADQHLARLYDIQRRLE